MPPCFDSRYGESKYATTLRNLLPENRQLFLISELHKIKNPFSLFRQRAENFPVERTLYIDAYRLCLSKNGIARQYCVSLGN